MMVAPMEQCLSDLRIDRWLGGELGAGDAHALETHAARCAACAARVETLTAGRDRLAAAPLPPALAAALAQRTSSGLSTTRPPLAVLRGGRDPDAPGTAPAPARVHASARRRIVLAAPVLAAAAAVLLWLRLPATGPHDTGATTPERTKGSARVTAFVVRDGLAHAAGPGEIVHPGDTLQLTYTAAAPGYLALLSRDGAGVVSVYFDDQGRAAAITPGQDVPLPHSIVLDDTLGRETVYALFCARDVALAPLQQQLASGPMTAPAGCHTEALVLEKRAP